jgi:hypothetical protein
LTNVNDYDNPFADVELTGRFIHTPSGEVIDFPGFHDGDGAGGQRGRVWRQRFMPTRPGRWDYEITFSDGSPGARGSFTCTTDGARPGPWRQDSENPRWLMTARGEHFLPTTVLVAHLVSDDDVRDVIDWAVGRGYNTIAVRTFNTRLWGDRWPNMTAFATLGNPANRQVDFDRFNVAQWRMIDELFLGAGRDGIFVAPWDGPHGFYGGRTGKGTVYPPRPLAITNEMRDRFDSQRNLSFVRYLIGRQGAFWNLAYWSLSNTEVFDIKDRAEIEAFGEYLASVTPFGRMITAQDVEQLQQEAPRCATKVTAPPGLNPPDKWCDYRWLSTMRFDAARKLNTIQIGAPDDDRWQQADLQNAFALEVTSRGFPVLGTESLWEGQPRSDAPLPVIWGNLMAGAHTAWADWRADTGRGRWKSLGRGWAPPLIPQSERVYHRIGEDTVGDEQLKIASDILGSFEFWMMEPHNDVVGASEEAYCLAEPGRQYLVYAPDGGRVTIELDETQRVYLARWFDPRTGAVVSETRIEGGSQTLAAPDRRDWVLSVLPESSVPDL